MGRIKFVVVFCLMMSLSGLKAAGATDIAPAQVLVMLKMAPAHFRPDSAYAGNYLNENTAHARIKLAQDVAAKFHLILLSGWPMPVLGIDCYLMELSGTQEASRVVKNLAGDKRIAWAQEINNFSAKSDPDPLYHAQPSAKFWSIDKLHRVSTGKDVRIAVIDSGIEDDHQDLRGQVSVRENFVEKSLFTAENHGTQVAGVIAAIEGNGIGIAGVAPGSKIMALRACWQESRGTICNSFTVGKALNFAISHGAKIINMSFTGPSDQLLRQLIEVAQERGIVVVAAVGNDDLSGEDFPASLPGVFAVANKISGARPAGVIYAPGQGIPTTSPPLTWSFVSGSSFSAAHVSGLMALIAQIRPKIRPEQIRRTLVTHSGYVAGPGSGNIDVCLTFQRLNATCVCDC